MHNLKGKKILFLGASNYFYDAALYAKSCGAYLIVIDYKPVEKAITKRIADEEYLMSTTDVDAVYALAKEKQVDGIYAGASEVNIPIAMEICKRLKLPYYCTAEQWGICTNKALFKNACIKYDIPVTPVYHLTDEFLKEDTQKIEFPVVTKPVDNNGSTGISICHNLDELKAGYKKAIESSKTRTILVEKYIPSDSVIIHYTLQNGEILFSGISDKVSRKLKDDGAPVMALQLFPSTYTNQYLGELNEKVCKMLKGLGMKNGSIWIESFYYNNEFIFNEIGYRFGGSLSYYPVEYFYGINQMNMMIHYSVTGEPLYNEKILNDKYKYQNETNIYCILPIHIKPCTIKEIEGIKEIKKIEGVHALVEAHINGETIEPTGTVSQVFAYLHVVAESKNEIKKIATNVVENLKVFGDDGENKIYSLFNINELI